MGRGLGRGRLRKSGSLWIADYTDHAGKRRRLSFGTSKAEAQARLNKVIRDRDLMRAGLLKETAGLDHLLTDLGEQYLLSLERRGVSAGYLRNSRDNLRDIIVGLRAVRASDVTAAGLEEYMDSKRRAGYANSLVYGRVAALSRVFKHAGLPWAAVTLPQLGRGFMKRPARALTAVEQDDLINECLRHDRVKGAMAVFLLDTGARHSEARQVRWEDVGAAEVHLRAYTTKTGHGRTIPFTERLQGVLADMPKTCGWVFPLKDGVSPQTTSSAFTHWLQDRAVAAGLALKTRAGVLHTHALRHTFATRLARAGVPIQQAQYLTGHKRMDVLLSIYTHLQADDVRDAISGI